MPELIAIYEDHADHRKQFEILAIHDSSAKSFAELDKKLPKLKEKFWQGKDLPFPILLDDGGATQKLFGIQQFPTGLLIDPEGKLVAEIGPEQFEAKLPPLSAAKKWARQRDLLNNFVRSFEPSQDTLAKLAKSLRFHARCFVELDQEAIKASGMSADAPLPGALFGLNVTWRSIDELLLAPHGLGITPSADGKKLLITKRKATQEPPSYFQKLHNKQLTERLDRGPTDEERKEAKPLRIKNQPLLEAVRLVEKEFQIAVGIDAQAMRTKAIDPEARVSGDIGPGDLRQGLTKMLEPLGLTVEVRHEVVLVTPRKKTPTTD